MRSLYYLALPLIFLSLILTAIIANQVEDEQKIQYLSPRRVVASPDGKKLFIAQYEGKKLDIFDINAQKIIKSVELDALANDLCIAADGQTVFVTTGDVDGKLLLIDIATGQIKQRFTVGYTPMSPVLSPDAKTIYICNRFTDEVVFVDVATGKVKSKVSVEREPYASVLSKDGRWLFVANHLPRRPAAPAWDDEDYMNFTVEASISVIDTEKAQEAKRIDLPDGAVSIRGVDISPDGKYVYATHILARYNVPTSQLERGWVDTNALSIINVDKQELYKTVLLDDIQLGAANPYQVKCSADGKYLAVSISGTHEIHIIDRPAMHQRLATVIRDEQGSIVDPLNYIPYMQSLRKRVDLPINGPRGLAVIGNKAYTTGYFSDSMAIVDLDNYQVEEIKFGPQNPLNQIRTGEKAFHDASLCYQKWLSCASCHPDGRVDGINWDLMNDGAGNPKNVKSMLFSHKTPPVMITGIRASAEIAVRAGFKFIQFADVPEETSLAVDAYLMALEPLPSPHLVDGQLSQAAQRGKKIFEKAYCNVCHSGPYFTDMKMHNLNNTYGIDEGISLDTPTLREVWRTAPYMHDGAAVTIMDVLTTFNPDDLHGKTSNLTEQELKDLAEYVLSL